MPIVGSTAYNQVSSVTLLVRSLLKDATGNVFTDSVLLPYLNSAYRKTQHRLRNSGASLFKTDDVLLVVKAVPSADQDPGTQTVLNDATPPPNQLPTNLLAPVKIWERANGSTNDFAEMVDLTEHGGLPSRIQTSVLQEWEWRTDGIYFVGATQDVQIRLRYYSMLPDLVGPTDVILIRGAQEALAYLTAAMAGFARENPMAQHWDDAGVDAMEDVVQLYTRMQQHSGTRRRPYGWRSGLLGRGRRWMGW